MDFSTPLGMIICFGLCVWGITVPKLGNFWDPPSLAIVLGGTIGAIIASYPFRILKEVPKHFMLLTRGKKYDVPKVIGQLVDLAMLARQSGLLALEEKAEELKEPFLKQSILTIVDANDPDKVRANLEKQLDDMAARHDEAAGVYEKASSYAPAFGMVGTLIGLVNMLKGMDLGGGGGASTLGADMSVALITTFYGSAFANIVLQPIAKKLRIRQSEEELYCMTVIEGVMGIQAGDNPKILREHLLSCMKQSQQKKLLLKMEKSGGEGGGA